MRQGASIDTAVRPANGEKVRAMRQDAPQSKPDSREGEAVSDMAVEVLKQQLADLTRDYTGACEAIRQLEANVAELRGALAADDSQLRAAEERVWPGMTHGCDAPDWLADELLWTRTQLAEARAEVERTNHIMRLERMARQDSEDRLKAQLAAAEAAMSNRDGDWVLALGHAAGLNSGLMVPIVPKVGPCRELLDGYAEAAREAVLASLAAAEAVAGEALKWAYRQLAHDHHYGFPLDPDKPDGVAFVARGLASLPTPSAALQRVREQAQREGAEQFLAALDAEMDARAEMVDVDLGDAFGAGYDQAHADFCEAGPQIIARLFPTTDAGGPA